jgi:hypothetical protein
LYFYLKNKDGLVVGVDFFGTVKFKTKKVIIDRVVEVYRFSADGGLWSFMFSDFMALHHLLLNGLPEPPHRSSSPLVA